MSPYYLLQFFFQFGISSKKRVLTFSVQYITYMSVMYVHMTLSLSNFFSIYIKATGTVPPAFQTHYSSKMENIFLLRLVDYYFRRSAPNVRSAEGDSQPCKL